MGLDNIFYNKVSTRFVWSTLLFLLKIMQTSQFPRDLSRCSSQKLRNKGDMEEGPQ